MCRDKLEVLHLFVVVCLEILLISGRVADAQSNCALQHSGAGVFICYPDPSQAATSAVPNVFHLSAQANAAEGRTIAGFKVLIDNQLASDITLPAPLQKLSIETNVKSPFSNGMHTLTLQVAGAGSAELQRLEVRPAEDAAFCNPFDRSNPLICRLSLQWSLTQPQPAELNGFTSYLDLYGRNLKNIKADGADAMAIDGQGNLYIASHTFSDVDLRKYGRDGSLLYSSLIRSCGEGFTSVTGLQVDGAGRAWVAGNTAACFSTTPNALRRRVNPSQVHGFIMLLDTSKPSANAPIYATYLDSVENRIVAIRVDHYGNAYVAGTTDSTEFPHVSLLRGPDAPTVRSTNLGFVSMLNPTGSSLLWSTLMPDTSLTSLALDAAGRVYVTGSTEARGSQNVVVAELSERGRRLSYRAEFGDTKHQQGRAISVDLKGTWLAVTGESDSADGLHSFVVALEPCQTGHWHSVLLNELSDRVAPAIAINSALDGFVTASASATARLMNNGTAPARAVQIAKPCPRATQ